VRLSETCDGKYFPLGPLTTFLGKHFQTSLAAGRASRLPRPKPHGISGASNSMEAEPQLY